jgi:hypothetical protein
MTTAKKVNDLWTNKGSAYAAAQWASGQSQRLIARQFGYKGAAPVCIAIERFIRRYVPTSPINSKDSYAAGRLCYGNESRRALVPKALAAFKKEMEQGE